MVFLKFFKVFKVFFKTYSYPIFCATYIASKLVWYKFLSLYSWSKFLPNLPLPSAYPPTPTSNPAPPPHTYLIPPSPTYLLLPPIYPYLPTPSYLSLIHPTCPYHPLISTYQPPTYHPTLSPTNPHLLPILLTTFCYLSHTYPYPPLPVSYTHLTLPTILLV